MADGGDGGSGKPPFEFLGARVPLDALIRKLKEPKDVRVSVSSAGLLLAVCKACGGQIQPADKDGLLWLVCPKCKGVSFIPIANVRRDIGLARQEGGVFEYEVYYLRELPPGFEPPAPAGPTPSDG